MQDCGGNVLRMLPTVKPLSLFYKALPYCLLISLLGLGLSIRMFRVEWSVLSSDESFSWRIITYSPTDLLRHINGDVHPPLYYLLLKGWTKLWGTSPASLRSLSVLFGTLSILMIYVVCRGASEPVSPSTASQHRSIGSGALFSAFLLAIHLSQVNPSRIARMYSMGVFFAGLTSWLLMCALRSQRRFHWWWFAYALAVVGFCYTHYYAFFTVAAQVIFVMIDLLVCRRKYSINHIAKPMLAFLFSGIVVLFLYSPWLPIWFHQTQDVWDAFWVPVVSSIQVQRVFFSWSSGLEFQGTTACILYLLPLAAFAIWLAFRVDRAGLFFLVQAGVPWVLSLTISIWGGRSIFQERYLVFAQFFLLGFWGVVWDLLPGLFLRLCLTCWLSSISLYGIWTAAEQWPSNFPAEVDAATFLKYHYQKGDIVLTDGPSDLNRLYYYAVQIGADSLPIRCTVNPLAYRGHVVHLASLVSEDIIWESREGDLKNVHRVWKATYGKCEWPPPGTHWKEILRKTFGEDIVTHYTLVLYESDF